MMQHNVIIYRFGHEPICLSGVVGANDDAVVQAALSMAGVRFADCHAVDILPQAAAELRFEDRVPVQPRQINAPRRREDAGNDLWRTFNRTQENLVRGDVSYTHTNDQGIRSRRTTRPVNGIDGNVALNRALWTLAAKMQELKAA